ncbi:hypothetical protein HPP92_018403 [Vanilla planifolia]|uniref:Uncharacterized protein n=1 Tax=Vanilla planifolia TaxID=51239 RepID=A0A835UQL5_VANPL|nr:hypothetical protein HPP92_018403 [Vanilla planifolia]
MGMFGEPLNFVKVSKPKKKRKMENHKPSTNQSFFILTDDNGGNDLEEQVPKQAMDDINGMFGEPLNFAKVSKPKKKGKPENHKPSTNQSFFILTDDNVGKDLEEQVPNSNSYGSGEESGLFEPTIFTKEAMNEINELFGKPLEF